MPYPTTLNYQMTEPRIGMSGLNTNNVTQAAPLGTVIRAADSAYGEGQFIYLAGVASTVAGSVVVFDQKAGTTTLATTTSRGPVAVAMAPTVAGQFGWYQVVGAGVVASSSATINTAVAATGTGSTTIATVSGAKIDGLTYRTAQDAPGSGFTGVQLDWPSMNGNT